MKRLLSGSLCAVLSFAFLPWAWGEGSAPTPLEPVVVTATRTEVPIGQVGSSVTVITQEEIRQQQASTVLEVLRNVPGLDVVRSGSAGATTSVFLRGANPDHTLVLIDGVQLNSPTMGMGELANLMVDNIERIEVVRGPQSTLYGSDAIGGVIQIITRQGRGRPQLSLFGEGGTYETSRTGLSVQGVQEKLSLSSSLAQDRSGGIQANDDNQNTTFSAHLGLEPLAGGSFHLISRYTGAKRDVPNSRLFFNPRSKQKTDSWAVTGMWDQALTDWWDWRLQLSFFDDDLEWQDPFFGPSRIDTQTTTADLRTNFHLGPYFLLTLGGEWERQKGKNSGFFNDKVISRAFYAQNQLNWKDRLFLTLQDRLKAQRSKPMAHGGNSYMPRLFPSSIRESVGALSHLQLYGRAENLFDDDYQEALEFPAPGALFLMGVRATF